MNAPPVPGRKFTAYLVVASSHSLSNHVRWPVGRFPGPGILSARTVGPMAAVPWDSLALASLGCGSGLRVHMARSSPSPTESSSRCGSFHEPLCYGLAVRFQLLSTDGLHHRSYFPLQVLGLRPDEDLHLAALTPSQSHHAAPLGLKKRS